MDVNDFVASGILEMYVMGNTNAEETAEVEQVAALYDDVRKEIQAISIALEEYAKLNDIEPNPSLRPFIMATIDYMGRLKKGETPTFPPMLHLGSGVEDYSQWLERDDLQPAEPVEDAYAAIIGYTPEATTAIVWLRYGAPPETHTDEQEKFLIVEGTCDITIGNDVHKMKPGDVLIIPLHISHHVRVTSGHPCKIILQRIAA